MPKRQNFKQMLKLQPRILLWDGQWAVRGGRHFPPGVGFEWVGLHYHPGAFGAGSPKMAVHQANWPEVAPCWDPMLTPPRVADISWHKEATRSGSTAPAGTKPSLWCPNAASAQAGPGAPVFMCRLHYPRRLLGPPPCRVQGTFYATPASPDSSPKRKRKTLPVPRSTAVPSTGGTAKEPLKEWCLANKEPAVRSTPVGAIQGRHWGGG